MIELRENYWAVEDSDPKHAVISGNTITWKVAGAQARGFRLLPPGSWQIICTSKDATAEQITCIIERNGEGWVDYDKDRFHSDIPFPYPMDSFNSLMEAKGCDVNLNYLILKKTA